MDDNEKECFIEVEFSDGGTARWAVTETEAGDIADMIENKIGPPNTLTL